MRRKTLLAWLALLGMGPGAAFAQYPASPSNASSQWISLNDEADLGTAGQTLASSSGACDACYGGGCGTCNPCGDPCAAPCCGPLWAGVRRWNEPGLVGAWADIDFLLWTVGSYQLPPLVTTAPNGQLPTLANPNTQVAFGNNDVDDDFRAGGRIRLGIWFDDTQSVGVEGHFFALEQTQSHFNFVQAGDGALSLGRPFFNTANVGGLIFGPAGPGQAALINAFDSPAVGPNTVVLNGAVEIDTSSNVYSAGALLRHFVAEEVGVRIDVLGGYRYFRFDEGLSITGTSITGPNAGPVFPIGLTFQQTDIFDTVNEFQGGEIGMVLERDFGELLSVSVVGKVALGNVHQEAHLQGYNSISFPGFPPVNNVGGLLVQTTNAGNAAANGTHERDEFAVLPEVNFNVGLQLTRQVRATVGWSMLYLSNVLRPGQQIDFAVDGRLLENNPAPLVPPATRPAFVFNDTDLWLYGVNFGIEATY